RHGVEHAPSAVSGSRTSCSRHGFSCAQRGDTMPTVQFWLNAFIPRTVTGYTQTLTAGPHTGKTAVPLPGIARLWPGNTFKDWNAGYLSDQRTFDSSLTASCRMQSILEVDIAGPPRMVGQTHRSSGTTEVNLSSGAQTGFAVADMSRCSY